MLETSTSNPLSPSSISKWLHNSYVKSVLAAYSRTHHTVHETLLAPQRSHSLGIVHPLNGKSYKISSYMAMTPSSHLPYATTPGPSGSLVDPSDVMDLSMMGEVDGLANVGLDFGDADYNRYLSTHDADSTNIILMAQKVLPALRQICMQKEYYLNSSPAGGMIPDIHYTVL